MTSIVQKETERGHLEALLQLERIGARVLENDRERPDFVLLIDGNRVGLEHCELADRDLAHGKDLLNRFDRKLIAELHRRTLVRDLEVAIEVGGSAPWFEGRREAEESATDFAEAIAARAAEAPKEFLHGAWRVRLRRVVGMTEGPTACTLPFLGGLPLVALMRAIRDKERLLPDYAADPPLDEVWLLLVTGANWAQMTDSALTEGTRVASKFQRVYLLDLRGEGRVQRVDDGGD